MEAQPTRCRPFYAALAYQTLVGGTVRFGLVDGEQIKTSAPNKSWPAALASVLTF
jgi:hypothetical protein